MTTRPSEQESPEIDVLVQEPAKVILFNDDVHTFEEVIGQLIRALKCTENKAEGIAWEAHSNGKAIAFSGELIRCMEISAVLEEIHLMTQIEV